MDDVRPWIAKKVLEGPLKRLESIIDDPSSSVLPLEAFRTQKIQFIRFHSPHHWGSYQPVWAEASDRDVAILVYISPEIVQKFESDQKADRRTFSELGYPTFLLGGCRWIWDAPPNKNREGKKLFNPQLCLKVVSDLPNKRFQLGSVASSPAPSYRSQNDSKQSRDLYLLGFALKQNSLWNLLLNKLRVTCDPRLTAPGLSKETTADHPTDPNSLVHVSIPHPGVSTTARGNKARLKKRQSKPYSKPIELPSKSTTAPGSLPSKTKLGPIRSKNAYTSSSTQVAPEHAPKQTPRSSTSVPRAQPDRFLIHFSSAKYPQVDPSSIRPGCTRPLSSAPFVLKIKGRKLAKYFA